MGLRLRMLALVDLAARYRRVISFHWRHRHQSGDKAYRATEAEFLPAALALIEKPVSATARVTGLLLAALALWMVFWAVLAHVDIVVSATGKVVPSGRTKAIASVDVASVRAIYVVEGQQVKAGDLLVELDAGTFEADERKATADVDAARLEAARARALLIALDTSRVPVLTHLDGISGEALNAAALHLTGQYLDYSAKLSGLDAEIERYARALPLAEHRASTYEELAKTHDVSADAWSEKLQAAIDLQGQLAQAKQARFGLVAETRRQALDSLAQAEKEVQTATQDVARAHSHARLLTLRAPVDGFVQQLAIYTVGGVVPAAQTLMLIVPRNDAIEVEANIDNKDVGFVRDGQSAEVKVDAFDYTRHGMVHGRVTSVSKDAVEDEKRGSFYRARVHLETSAILIEGRARSLAPGMTVKVEIKTGTRRVIEYVLSPLLRHGHESLNER